MTEVIVHPELASLPAKKADRVLVQLYGSGAENCMAAIAGPVLDVVSRIATPVDPTAFDFLSLSLAVTAADTFTSRREAADGWAREIHLTTALADPDRWTPPFQLWKRRCASSAVTNGLLRLRMAGRSALPCDLAWQTSLFLMVARVLAYIPVVSIALLGC